jgi:diadenosine tetraphosphate (Ap4A) HIT family hydrolase
MPTAFTLDHRLAGSARFVADLPLCWVALKNDKTYPWLYLVPRRDGIREIFDLPPEEQEQLIGEIARAGRVLQKLFHPAKINTAALGNMVAQLHVHVFARFTDDPAWPSPVWAVQGDEIPYTEEEYGQLIARLQTAFAEEDA